MSNETYKTSLTERSRVLSQADMQHLFLKFPSLWEISVSVLTKRATVPYPEKVKTTLHSPTLILRSFKYYYAPMPKFFR
jgi:hypothetical protein